MNRSLLWPSLLILALIAAIAATLLWDVEPQNSHTLAGSIRSEAPTGGDFTVNTVKGELSISDLHGKLVLLYFGYTLCPDICPTSLGFTSTALSQLDNAELSQVQVVFVSVDPDRDSVQHLDDYARYFHPTMIGATADKATIDHAVDLYGASYRMVESNSSLEYLVDHSASIYLIDRDGKLRETIAHGTIPAEMVKLIRNYL